MSVWRSPVSRGRGEGKGLSGGLGRGKLDLGPIANGGIEAAAPSGVAGRARLADAHKQAVAVAIDPEVDKLLHVTGRVAFSPELFS
jgi:hypothetical protein